MIIPDDGVVFGYCSVCLDEIWDGETVYRIDGQLVHGDCLAEFAEEYFKLYKIDNPHYWEKAE